MKIVLLIAAIALLTSCDKKQTYQCKCYDSQAIEQPYSMETRDFKEYQDWCNGLDERYTLKGGGCSL